MATHQHLRQASDAKLIHTLRESQARLDAEYAHLLHVVHELDRRGIAVNRGFIDTARFLRHALRISRREADIRTELARALMSSDAHALCDQHPALTASAEALESGSITVEHAKAILATTSKLPTSVPLGTVLEIERRLLAVADDAGPEAVRRAGLRATTCLIQNDAPHSAPSETNSLRHARYRRHRNGGITLTARFDPCSGEQIVTTMDLLAAESMTGNRDCRSLVERRGDAVLTAFTAARKTFSHQLDPASTLAGCSGFSVARLGRPFAGRRIGLTPAFLSTCYSSSGRSSTSMNCMVSANDPEHQSAEGERLSRAAQMPATTSAAPRQNVALAPNGKTSSPAITSGNAPGIQKERGATDGDSDDIRTALHSSSDAGAVPRAIDPRQQSRRSSRRTFVAHSKRYTLLNYTQPEQTVTAQQFLHGISEEKALSSGPGKLDGKHRLATRGTCWQVRRKKGVVKFPSPQDRKSGCITAPSQALNSEIDHRSCFGQPVRHRTQTRSSPITMPVSRT